MLIKEQQEIIQKHQKSAPVKVTPIARDLGLPVYRVSEWGRNLSGMLKKDPRSPSGYAIFVNASDHDRRKRFTIAHEIGHYMLHESLIKDGIVEDALLRAEGLSNAVEAQANAFAADLLMPWHLIRQQQEKGINSIEQLADAFDVSRDAMSIRLIGVSYERAQEMNAAE